MFILLKFQYCRSSNSSLSQDEIQYSETDSNKLTSNSINPYRDEELDSFSLNTRQNSREGELQRGNRSNIDSSSESEGEADNEIRRPIPPRHECKKCQIIQPYRTRHCKLCGACVAKFDHHCFWIGSCVGELNHRMFWWMLFSLTVEFLIGFSYVSSTFNFLLKRKNLFFSSTLYSLFFLQIFL